MARLVNPGDQVPRGGPGGRKGPAALNDKMVELMITNLIGRDAIDEEVIYPSAWRGMELKLSPPRMGFPAIGVRLLGLARDRVARRR